MAERAVVYLRVSSQAQETTIQRRECGEYVAAHGYDVVEVVEEKETGVDSFDWRPGLGKVRDLLRSGAANVLVVWKFDRANRDSIDNLLLLRLADSAHARLESVHDGVVENDMAGRMRMFMHGESGRNERDGIVLRTHAGRRERVLSGMPLVGNYPLYGYRYTYGPGKHVGERRKTGYEVEPETAAIVRRCFERVVAGANLYQVARELNDSGVPTPRQWLANNGLLKGGTKGAQYWRRQALYRMLSNESYAGRHVQYKGKLTRTNREQDGEKPRYTMRPRIEDDGMKVTLAIPAIVSEELFSRVQAIMAAKKAESKRRNADPESTLLRAGFAVCGHCHSAMRSHVHTPTGHRRYICQNRRVSSVSADRTCPAGEFSIVASAVDSDIWRKVSEIARDTDKVQRLIDSRRNKAQGVLEDVQRESAALTADIETYETQRGTLQRRMAIEQDDGVYAALREELQRVNAILKGLEKKRKAVSIQVGKYTITLVSLRELVQRLELGKPRTLAEIAASLSNDPLANATYAEKREIMRLLGVKVLMYKKDSDYARAHNGERWELTFTGDSEPLSRWIAPGPLVETQAPSLPVNLA